MESDIIELRNGGTDGVDISINLINARVTTQLRFGLNADLTNIWIDGDVFKCGNESELAYAIRIQNKSIIHSACIGEFVKSRSNLDLKKVFLLIKL